MKFVGKTTHEGDFVEVFECENCGARQVEDKDNCYYCERMIKEHHEEEAFAGII